MSYRGLHCQSNPGSCRPGHRTYLLPIYSHQEKEGGIAPIDDLVVAVLNEGTLQGYAVEMSLLLVMLNLLISNKHLLLSPGQASAHNLPLQGTSFLNSHALVCVLGQTGLALFVHQQHKLDSHLA